MNVGTMLRAGALALAALPVRNADAHAILMASKPAAAGHVAQGDLQISLRFNSLIDIKRSRLVLVRPDGEEVTLPITSVPTGETMLAHVQVVTPGDNLLRWQVLAVDGHITRGNVPFDVLPGKTEHGAPASAR
jgi:methionine-rich copper-binding protein CopC